MAPSSGRIGRAAALVAVASGCAITPLTNKIAVGDEAYVIVLGEAADGNTDLFAGPAGGGTLYRFTFNRPVEDLPRLSPNGKTVAFVRRLTAGDTASTELVAFDLTTATERAVLLPAGARAVERLGWSPDGARLFLLAGRFYSSPAPPGRLELSLVPPDSVAMADSSSRQLLGEPVFGMIDRCPSGEACVKAGDQVTPLGSDVSDAIRWGPDSMAYLREGRLEVRPLGGGRPRVPVWIDPPLHLRRPTYFAGSAEAATR